MCTKKLKAHIEARVQNITKKNIFDTEFLINKWQPLTQATLSLFVLTRSCTHIGLLYDRLLRLTILTIRLHTIIGAIIQTQEGLAIRAMQILLIVVGQQKWQKTERPTAEYAGGAAGII